MTRERASYSATMAKVYAGQGYLRKAAQIYRDLLAQNPDQEEIRSALAELNQVLGRHSAPSRKELGLLFKEWIHLMSDLKHRRRCRAAGREKKTG